MAAYQNPWPRRRKKSHDKPSGTEVCGMFFNCRGLEKELELTKAYMQDNNLAFARSIQ